MLFLKNNNHIKIIQVLNLKKILIFLIFLKFWFTKFVLEGIVYSRGVSFKSPDRVPNYGGDT